MEKGKKVQKAQQKTSPVNDRAAILEVENLSISFSQYDRGWNKEELQVIRSLDVSIRQGEILAVVGSSGSGKGLLAHEILGILPPNATSQGKIRFMGQTLGLQEKKEKRGRDIVLIPQSVDFLDPLMKVGKQVTGEKGGQKRMKEVFDRLGLPEGTEDKYPFQLSGGMARRVLIATALMEDPKLIVADEPTPGLEIQRAMETLGFFRKIADEGTGILLITHDIDLALHVADRIAVFYAGTTVEVCPVGDFRGNGEALRHPYTKALLEALPQNKFAPFQGIQPYATRLYRGCVFIDRCPKRGCGCEGDIPMRALRGGEVRCIHAE